MTTVFVTGANGFVGRRLCSDLALRGHVPRAGVRELAKGVGLPGEAVAVGSIGPATDWSSALEGVDVVVHLAARVHVMRDTAADPLVEFRALNVDATERLARAAVAHGVKRFVFVSSVKVNGESTDLRPFTVADAPAPQDPYGVSKWEAECVLQRIADESGLELVVVRPPLVYGPGVAGNFLRLLKLVRRGVPLPFGAIENRRSMVYVGNLAHALVSCSLHPNGAGQTYLVSDGVDLSIGALVLQLAAALGTRVHLVSVPRAWLQFGGILTGKSAEVDRIIGSLTVDPGKICSDLAWSPPFTVNEGLIDTARWFMEANG